MNEKHSLFVLYYIKIYSVHLQYLIILNILENANSVLITPFQVKGLSSVPLHAALYYCTVLLNDNVM